jgi:hypothetical protein
VDRGWRRGDDGGVRTEGDGDGLGFGRVVARDERAHGIGEGAAGGIGRGR